MFAFTHQKVQPAYVEHKQLLRGFIQVAIILVQLKSVVKKSCHVTA
jgi:hypothetical protein